MPFAIETESTIVQITLSGTLTNDDLSGLAREGLAFERSLAHVPDRLTDLRSIMRLDITFQGVLEFANQRMRQTFPNSFKSAIVASDVAHYGFARMFQTLNDHPQIDIAIFPDPARAMRWLEAPVQDPPRGAPAPRSDGA